jgi:hypothetical protein
MEDVIRGACVHVSSEGLQYYVHYQKKGNTKSTCLEYKDAIKLLEIQYPIDSKKCK